MFKGSGIISDAIEIPYSILRKLRRVIRDWANEKEINGSLFGYAFSLSGSQI